MIVWHLRQREYARAFASSPTTLCEAFTLFRKGWRPFNENWWSRCNKNQRALEGAGRAK